MKTEHLKNCDILLCKGKTFSSWLIQFGTSSKYSHVAVVIDPKINLAVEANIGHQAGVRAVDLRKLNENSVDVFRVKSNLPFNAEKAISFLVAKLGAGFDWLGVTWLGVLKVASLFTAFKFKPHNEFQRQKDYFCSELCYEAFKEGGLDIVPQIGEAEITSPGDISRSDRLEPVAI